MLRSLAVGACVAVGAAIGLAVLALALNLSSRSPNLAHFEDANRTEPFAFILVVLGVAMAAAARHAPIGARRGGLALTFAGGVSGAVALLSATVGVVRVYGSSGFDLYHAYAWLTFARTPAFAALAFAVLGSPLARRSALALAGGLGLTAVGAGAYAISLPYGNRFFAWTSFALAFAIVAAAAAFSARRPPVGEVDRR
jgi:hypothetical protein